MCTRPEELERARAQLTGQGAEVLAVPCDVSDADQVARMVRTVDLHYGRIDILVNNAGEIRVAPMENLTIADFERSMAVMFWGVVHTTLAVLPTMRSRGEGRIATITSIGGKVSVPHLLSYSCAKAAAVAFTQGLRNEVRQHGIQVTTIVPGLMRTRMWASSEARHNASYSSFAEVPSRFRRASTEDANQRWLLRTR